MHAEDPFNAFNHLPYQSTLITPDELKEQIEAQFNRRGFWQVHSEYSMASYIIIRIYKNTKSDGELECYESVVRSGCMKSTSEFTDLRSALSWCSVIGYLAVFMIREFNHNMYFDENDDYWTWFYEE